MCSVLVCLTGFGAEKRLSDLGDAHGILRPTADEVKLPELPQLGGPVGLNSAAHRLVEGIAASLAGGSTRPLVEIQQGTLMRSGPQEQEVKKIKALNGCRLK